MREVPAKIVLIILDGLGDTTQSFGSTGRIGTCLSCSKHPALNSLAKTGVNGLNDSVSPGFSCGSDTAHLSLFGYSPFVYYNGRGAFEALGGGMEMEPGSIAFKSNFSTMCGETVKYRRCDRHFEKEGPILCKDLDGITIEKFPEVEVKVVYATEHRCAVCINAPGLSDKITGTDPLSDGKPLFKSHPRDDSSEAQYTANVVNALSDTFRRALEKHSINIQRKRDGKQVANVILLRGPGMRLQVQSFYDRHKLRTFMIAPTAIIAGLGKSIELPVIDVKGATGDMHSDYTVKVEAAAKHIEKPEYDMGIIHMKGIDDASHDGDYESKLKLIERADAAIKLLIQRLSEIEIRTGQRFVVSVISDHSTSSSWGDHTFEPVPFCVSDVSQAAKELGMNYKRWNNKLFEADSVQQFDENKAGRGILGRFCGSRLIGLLKYFSGREIANNH